MGRATDGLTRPMSHEQLAADFETSPANHALPDPRPRVRRPMQPVLLTPEARAEEWESSLRDCELENAAPVDADSSRRKDAPIYTGVLRYFPDAIWEVARCSKLAGDKHHPGEPIYWERGKSTDQEDCLVRHLLDAGKIDSDGIRHSAKVAWRALAALQLEIERDRAACDYDR